MCSLSHTVLAFTPEVLAKLIPQVVNRVGADFVTLQFGHLLNLTFKNMALGDNGASHIAKLLTNNRNLQR